MYMNKSMILFLLIIISIVLLSACAREKTINELNNLSNSSSEIVGIKNFEDLKKEIDEMDDNQIFYFLNNQEVMFEYTNKEIMNMLLYKVKQMDDPDKIHYLIDSIMRILENRGLSYEYTVASMVYPASKYFEYIKTGDVDKIDDRVLKPIIKEMINDGYTMNDSNGFVMISFNPEEFLDTFKDYLPDSYIKIHEKLYEFRNFQTVIDSEMNFNLMADTILELEGLLEENKSSYAYGKTIDFQLDKIRFLLGLIDENFVINEDGEFLEEYINALNKIKDNSPNEFLSESMAKIIELINEEGKYSEEFLTELEVIFNDLANKYFLESQMPEPEASNTNEDLGTYYQNIYKYTEGIEEIEGQ